MKLREAFLLGLLIVAPLILVGFVGLSSQPVQLASAISQAQVDEAQGNHASAAKNLRILISYYPGDTALWERIGGQELAAENYTGAIQAFTAASRAGKLSIAGQFDLGNAYDQSGDRQTALSTWRSILGRDGITAERYQELLDLFQKYGDWDAATQTAQEWYQTDHYNDQVSLTLGKLLSYQDPAAAVKVLSDGNFQSNSDSRAASQLIQAIQTGQEKNEPSYLRVLVGQTLGDLNDWEIAIQAFRKALELEPNYAEAWALLGEAQQMVGQDGYPALQQALTLDPTSDIVRVAMALYYRRQEEPQKALVYLRALAAKYPQQGQWQVEIGATLAEDGNLIEAMNAYQNAVEIEPNNAANWRALALFSANNGFDANSYTLPAASQALLLDPDGIETLDMAGWINLTLGDLDNAEQFLQQALQKDATYPPALLHMGQLYLKKGQTDQAYPLLKRAVQQTRDAATALQAQRLLEKYFPQ